MKEKEIKVFSDNHEYTLYFEKSCYCILDIIIINNPLGESFFVLCEDDSKNIIEKKYVHEMIKLLHFQNCDFFKRKTSLKENLEPFIFFYTLPQKNDYDFVFIYDKEKDNLFINKHNKNTNIIEISNKNLKEDLFKKSEIDEMAAILLNCDVDEVKNINKNKKLFEERFSKKIVKSFIKHIHKENKISS